MPQLGLTVTSATATAIYFTLSNLAVDGVVEMQVSTRPDFKLNVCPIFTLPLGPEQAIAKVNQNADYYLRARSRRASGALEDWSPVAGARTGESAPRDLAPGQVLIEPALVVVPSPVLEWSAVSEIAGFPAANLGRDSPVAWRSSNGDSHTLYARLAPTPIDTVALLMSNAPEDATVVVAAGNAKGATSWSSGFLPFRASANLPGRPGYHALIRLPDPQAYPWWQIGIGANCPGAVFHLEHAVFGLARVSKNHANDRTETPVDLGVLERARSGVPQRTIGYRMRRADFEIAMMTQAQYESLYGDLGRLVGATEPALVVPNSRPGSFLHDRILYGAITGGRASNPSSPVFSRSFTIDSLV